MNQFNLFDLLLLGFASLSVLIACWRGLGREVLHTLLFTALMVASYFYLAAQEPPVDKEAAARMLVNYGYIVATFYLLTWIVLRVLAPVFLSTKPVSMRERFWAGALAVSKIMAAGLALNMWYAMNTEDAHPLRLNMLPDVLRSSVVVQLSDKATDDLYRWAASQGWTDYDKYVDRPLTDDEKDMIKTQEKLGIR